MTIGDLRKLLKNPSILDDSRVCFLKKADGMFRFDFRVTMDTVKIPDGQGGEVEVLCMLEPNLLQTKEPHLRLVIK